MPEEAKAQTLGEFVSKYVAKEPKRKFPKKKQREEKPKLSKHA